MSPVPLNQLSGMPQMGAAFSGWQKKITLTRIVQQVVRGIVTDVPTSLTFQGTIQPLNPRLIMLKPEGQRSFTWLQIHAFASSLNLDDNDRISGLPPPFDGKNYKIMGVYDYSLNNFIEYHAIEDYEGTI